MTMTSNGHHNISFTQQSHGNLFEVLWAWVNEDSRTIVWNIIECGSIDEIGFALDSLPEDVWVKKAAPAAWMARSRKAARLAAPRKAAEQAAANAAFLATLAPGEVPF